MAAAQEELDSMLRGHLVSPPVYARYRRELETQLEKAESDIAEIYRKDESRVSEEIRLAKVRLIAAEKSSIEEAVHEGVISAQSAKDMIDAADLELDRFSNPNEDSGHSG